MIRSSPYHCARYIHLPKICASGCGFEKLLRSTEFEGIVGVAPLAQPASNETDRMPPAKSRPKKLNTASGPSKSVTFVPGKEGARPARLANCGTGAVSKPRELEIVGNAEPRVAQHFAALARVVKG